MSGKKELRLKHSEIEWLKHLILVSAFHSEHAKPVLAKMQIALNTKVGK